VAKELIDSGIYGKELDQQVAYLSQCMVGSYTMHEQLPDEDNRVTLSKTRFDELGLPMLDIDRKLVNMNKKVPKKPKRYITKWHMPLGRADFYVIFYMASDAHAMGTTIMGDDPKNSVVNADCCCHDVDNLYI
jgi:choline dehydrogenase-like flavoprotein